MSSKKFLKKKSQTSHPRPARQRRSSGFAADAASKPASIDKTLTNSAGHAPQARTRRAHTAWDLIELSDLSVDGGTQSRVEFNVDALEDYAERMTLEPVSGLVLDQDGEPWPALVVFDDGKRKWLADGFHRMRAARKAGLNKFQVDLKRGELRDAIRLSLGVNAKHGLRRTNEDKRLAVMRALQDSEWVRYSDRKVAELCSVSAPTVSKLRKELEHQGDIEVAEERIGNDGRVQDTSTRKASKASGATKKSAQSRASERFNRVSLHQTEKLSKALKTEQIKASSLDSLDRKKKRGVVLVGSEEGTDLQAVCDHLDHLMGKKGGVVVMPVPDTGDTLLELLQRFKKRRGTTRVVALEQSQELILVHSERTEDRDNLLPKWIKGLSDLMAWCGSEDSVYLISSSREG